MPRGKPLVGNVNKGGRPLKDINKHTFESLCQIQCTQEEICAVLDVTDKTLTNWCKETYDGLSFSEVFAIKREAGKASLRRNQWKTAEKNPTRQIWLGKQYLGQRDKQDIEHSGEMTVNNKQELYEKYLKEE